jgi:hypothetical protein
MSDRFVALHNAIHLANTGRGETIVLHAGQTANEAAPSGEVKKGNAIEN